MARWALGVAKKNKIKNKYVRGTAKIAKLGEKLRGTRLRWYGAPCVSRKNSLFKDNFVTDLTNHFTNGFPI